MLFYCTGCDEGLRHTSIVCFKSKTILCSSIAQVVMKGFSGKIVEWNVFVIKTTHYPVTPLMAHVRVVQDGLVIDVKVM